ncbi:hypothetical protein KSF78_0006289 [Schistosoma japonicum]|nr:hypothetical protein KSF78_0006289 [Schistosoma japonicum]
MCILSEFPRYSEYLQRLGSNPTVNLDIGMQVHPADESQIGRKARPGFHLPVTIQIK